MRRTEQKKALNALDQLAVYRSDSIRAAKRYALLSGAISIPIAFVAAGMPGHFLWRWLGVPLILAFLYTSGLLLFHGARLLWDWLEDLGKGR